jgi:amino acid transporter
VAYGPEAILLVPGTAGLAALHMVLLALLVSSCRQVIDGYPVGGGACAISRANVGSRLARLAAASLVVEFTLTVTVSIAAGVSALTSTFPSLIPLTVRL